MHLLQDTFIYSSSYWTNTAVYNDKPALANIENEEAKFSAYHKLGFSRICLGMKQSDSSKRWIEIHTGSVTSLYNHIADGTFRSTGLSKSTWSSLVSGNYLQPHCNQQGFNVVDRARIGIMSNNENNCVTPDSVIGFGLGVCNCECPVISSGNFYSCVGDLKIRLSGYILVQ